jgi:uncharacterized protein (TIGR03382 family)
MRGLGLVFGLMCVSQVALAANVRSDRPRLMLGNGNGPGVTAAAFKQRCLSDPNYARCKNAIMAGGGLYPAINDAAGYVVNADASGCTRAMTTLMNVAGDTPGMPDPHSFISNNGRTMAQLAVVRDWCDPVLSSNDKNWLETKITSFADWYVSPACTSQLDIWHDDMNNVWNAVALAGLTLTGTAQDAKAQTYLQKADTQWKTVIFPALGYEGDYWHEGFTYVQPSMGSAIWYATAWSIATDENLYAWAKTNAKDLFEGWIAFHIQSMRPNSSYVYFGDTTDNKQTVELFSRQYIDMMTLGTGSALGQRMSLEIKVRSRPGYDYSGADGYLMALFYDASKDGAATPLQSVPLSRWMSRGAADVVTMRSGWGPDDTFVWMSCGDYFGAHQHIEAGGFQIFKGAQLTGSTGYYDNFDTDHWANWYSQHSVHANTVAVVDPNEFFPTLASIADSSKNVNEGGQRPLRRNKQGTGFPNPDLATYMMHKTAEPYVDTADVKAFGQTICETYVACDMTAAYSSAGHVANGNMAKVKEVGRQLVYLPPNIVVVADRIESTNAAFDKRFILHTPPSPTVQGVRYTLANKGNTLWATTAFPTQNVDVKTYTNFTIDGIAHPPQTTGIESFGTRLEISPQKEDLRDYFIHVFSTAATEPTVTATDGPTELTANIDDGARQYTLTFAKTGAMGGTLTIKAGATMVCSETLGGPMTPPDGGPDDDGGMNGDGGRMFDGASDGPCGCNSTGEGGSATAILIALGLVVRRRRKWIGS